MKTIYRAENGQEFEAEHLCARYEALCGLAADLKLHHIPAANVIEVLVAIDGNSNWLLQDIGVRAA